MALDYVISQLSQTETTRDYALLLVHGGIAVFGSLSNTNIKILVGIDAQESLKADLRSVSKSHFISSDKITSNIYLDHAITSKSLHLIYLQPIQRKQQ